MAKSQKWAEQCLEENTFGHTDENGNEVAYTLNCLSVCLTGKELYRKEFLEGKYKGKNTLQIPFDFIVEAGDMCPSGMFYELEYTIGEHGVVYRALVQAVDPVTDLPLIIATLKKKNILPANFMSHRAWLRDDIQAVCVGHCSKDEDGEVVFESGINNARATHDATTLSVLDYAVKYGNLGCCIYYYRGDCREVWVTSDIDCSKDKVFVCGQNGDDPEFAERRENDLDDMRFHLEEAKSIADDYGAAFFAVWNADEDHHGVYCSDGMNVSDLEALVNDMKKRS